MSDLGDAATPALPAAGGQRALKPVARLAVTGAILFLLCLKIDPGVVVQRLHRVEILPLAVAVALTAAQVLVGAMRWQVVLDGLQVALGRNLTLRLFTIGAFFNICMPMGVGGDAYRIWSLRRASVALRVAASSVLQERLYVVLVLSLVTLLEYPVLAPIFSANSAFRFLPILSLGGLGSIAALTMPTLIPERWRRWHPLAVLAMLATDARRLFFRPRPFTMGTGLSILGIGSYCLAIYFLARSLEISLPVGTSLLLVPSVMIVMLLPISVGGWGLREGALVVALGAVGIPAEPALALSILAGAVVMVVSLAGGVLWLLSTDLRRR